MNIEQTHTGDTEARIIHDAQGNPYLLMDDLIQCLRAWANANPEQVAIRGLQREIIKLRNKHQKVK
jgi:hypothetical protein